MNYNLSYIDNNVLFNVVERFIIHSNVIAKNDNKLIIGELLTNHDDEDFNPLLMKLKLDVLCDIKDWKESHQGFDFINTNQMISINIQNDNWEESDIRITYIKMQNKLLQDKRWQCFLIDNKIRKTQPWVVTVDGNVYSHDNIKVISLSNLYEVMTGQKNAYQQLCSVLPLVVNDVITTTKLSNS